jgi:hypothetical protein
MAWCVRAIGACGCLAVAPGVKSLRMIAIDYGHLSAEGSDFVARTILIPSLLQLRGRTPWT